MASVPLRNKRRIQRSQSVYLHSRQQTSVTRQHSVKDARERRPLGTVNVAINVSCRLVCMDMLNKCDKLLTPREIVFTAELRVEEFRALEKAISA